MKLVITGGAGFMGANFIRYVLRTYPNYRVVNFDKLTYAGNLDNLRDIEHDPRYAFVRGDIADRAVVKKAFSGCTDMLVNFAAETHVDRSIMDPDAFLRTSVFGTHVLLEAAREQGVKKILHVSTDEVYGSVLEGEANESSPYAPNSPYAASKAAGDHLCRAHFTTYGTPVAVSHSCNFYGPYQYPEKVIPLFITNILEGKKVPLYGDGLQVREWLHTEDACRALDAILHRGKPGEVYNMGTGYRITNKELTGKVLALLGKDESFVEPVKDRPGHDRRYAISHEKLTRELGWQPQVSFDDGLRRTVEWYRANEGWWKEIKSGEYLEYYKKQYKQ